MAIQITKNHQSFICLFFTLRFQLHYIIIIPHQQAKIFAQIYNGHTFLFFYPIFFVQPPNFLHNRLPHLRRLQLLCLAAAAVLVCAAAVWRHFNTPQIELPYLTARDVAAMDVNTGRFVYKQDIGTPCSPASLTKLMTLFLVLDDLESGAFRWEDTFMDRSALQRVCIKPPNTLTRLL